MIYQLRTLELIGLNTMENIHEILECIYIVITISHGVHLCQFTAKVCGIIIMSSSMIL